jgi:hypothetical protein
MCWIVTRISFIFSMSFIIYLLHLLYIYICCNYFENSRYKERMLFIHFIYNIRILIYIIILILMCFVTIFTNYALLLKGLINNKLNIKNIIYLLIFIILTIIISYMILGISRLYFI